MERRGGGWYFSKTSAKGGEVVVATIIGVLLALSNLKYRKHPSSLAVRRSKQLLRDLERLE